MKQYKQFFIKTILIFLILAIAIPSVLIFIGYKFVGKYRYSNGAKVVYHWMSTKKERAKELNKHGNKIVFLSGSNTIFGLDSKYAEKVTGLPVLNYGVHAAFDTYLFDDVKSSLKSGDIVIMPLEFGFYKEDTSTALPSPFAEYIISYDKEYYDKANFSKKLGIVFFLIQYAATHIDNIIKDTPLDEMYAKQINDYGDIVGHTGLTEKFKRYGKHSYISEQIPEKYDNFHLYHFIQYAKENNIKLYATMPNIWHSPTYAKEEKLAFNKIKNFYDEQDVVFIGDITSGSIADQNKFNDTGYHTNATGQRERTDWFIKNILSLPEIKNINK